MQKSLAILIVSFLFAINFYSAVGKVHIQIAPFNEKQLLESYENHGFGYRLYDPDSQYEPGPVFFKLDDPGTVYTIAYDNNTITGGCYNSYTYTWYVCDDLGNIWTIDIWSGDMTLIGGNSESLEALAYDPQTDTMYGAYQDFLYGIGMQTGNKLWEWLISEIYDISGLAPDGFGNLIIVDKISDNLWQLDIETLTPTYIGPLNIDIKGNADLEFDFNTNNLYMCAYTTQGELYKWDGEAVLIGNFEGGVRISGFIIPWNWPPYPPEPPRITGPTHGKINIEYEYHFVSTDPDGDDLTYIIDWDDGNIEEHGLYPAGEEITVKHAWSEEGTYTIKAKTRKLNGLESKWSFFKVTMLRYKAVNAQFLSLLENHPSLFKLLHLIFQ